MSDHLWYPEVQQALRSSSHLFLHYCAFHRVDEDGQTILEELRENGYMPECFDLSRIGTFSPLGDTNVVILLQMERLRETPRALEQIRFSVNEWATSSGGNVLIVSRSPRSAFPIGDGSSLVLDSRDLHLKASRFADWIVADFETNHGPAPEGAAHSRGLAEKLLSGRCRDDLSLLPGLVSDTACKTIFEMGPYYIAWLEEWVFECGMTCIPVVDVQEWMQSELILAGVARLDLDQQNLLLFDRALGSAWFHGLRSASKLCTTAPQDWRELSACFFEIERTVRQVLALAFEERLGRKWPKQVLRLDQMDYIRQAAGTDERHDLHRLSNPLDYLTLGQLLDLATDRTEASMAGISGQVVLDLRRLLPIRNRIGHMRLPKPDDLNIARSTLRRLRMVLDAQRRSGK